MNNLRGGAGNAKRIAGADFRQTPSLKTAITTIKKDLLSQGLYRYDKYTSMDVYQSVLTEGITNTQAFLKKHPLPTL